MSYLINYLYIIKFISAIFIYVYHINAYYGFIVYV